MLEIVNQLDGFDARGNIKVLMATNRPDTLAIPRSCVPVVSTERLRSVYRTWRQRPRAVFKIHTRSMAVERDIRYELLARLCPNATGAEIHSVCTEAGMFAIRQRRETAKKDFLPTRATKVIKGYQSSPPPPSTCNGAKSTSHDSPNTPHVPTHESRLPDPHPPASTSRARPVGGPAHLPRRRPVMASLSASTFTGVRVARDRAVTRRATIDTAVVAHAPRRPRRARRVPSRCASTATAMRAPLTR